MSGTTDRQKWGFSLLEVMIASLIVFVVAIGFSAALSSTAKQRMEARLRSAALIEANSNMELVLAGATTNVVADGQRDYIDIDTNTYALTRSSSDPGLLWWFDGESYDKKITVTAIP